MCAPAHWWWKDLSACSKFMPTIRLMSGKPDRSVLDFLGCQESDRLKPKILSTETIERLNPYMSQIVNRFRAASMSLSDDTLYVLEVVPAGYAGYAANEAEKAADITINHVSVYGASGEFTWQVPHPTFRRPSTPPRPPWGHWMAGSISK